MLCEEILIVNRRLFLKVRLGINDSYDALSKRALEYIVYEWIKLVTRTLPLPEEMKPSCRTKAYLFD